MPDDSLNFLELLQTFRRGELLAEADERLTDVVSAMQRFGGKGSITLKLGFEVNKAGQIECTPSIDTKAPRRALSLGIYYPTDDGTLSRRDPNQMEMFNDLEARRARDH